MGGHKEIPGDTSHQTFDRAQVIGAKGPAKLSVTGVTGTWTEVRSDRIYIRDEGFDPSIIITLDTALEFFAAKLTIEFASTSHLEPLLYMDSGYGFVETNTLTPIDSREGRHSFFIPTTANLVGLRYDPTNGPCEITINSIVLEQTDTASFKLRGFSGIGVAGMSLDPMSGVAEFFTDDPQLHLRVTEAIASEPHTMLEVALSSDCRPRLYFGNSETASIDLIKHNGLFRAAICYVRDLPFLRLDPSDHRGHAVLTHVEIRKATEYEIAMDWPRASRQPYVSPVQSAIDDTITMNSTLGASLADAPHSNEMEMSEVDRIATSEYFDEFAYEGTNEAKSMGLSSAEHYVGFGEPRGLSPSNRFDPKYYARRNPDVAGSGIGLLYHFIKFGRFENRAPVAAALAIVYPVDRIDAQLETVIVLFHEATRTGAAILGWNIVKRLAKVYNVVALLKRSGPLETDIRDVATQVVVVPDEVTRFDVELDVMCAGLAATYRPQYALANSGANAYAVSSFERAGVPVISLIHEFASTLKPPGYLFDLIRFSSEIVFSAPLVAAAALRAYPHLSARVTHVLPQGQSRLPNRRGLEVAPGKSQAGELLAGLDRDDVLVLGIGTITPRKGVDLFVSCAAHVRDQNPSKNIVFAWVGRHYAFDQEYFDLLDEQVLRSGFGSYENGRPTFVFIDELEDLSPMFDRADLFFLSSRLDPLPNVTIDASLKGIPVVCFDEASGFAELLNAHHDLRHLVVPHLDSTAAATTILSLAGDAGRRKDLARLIQDLAVAQFDLPSYVAKIDALGIQARQSTQIALTDARTIAPHEKFDASYYLGKIISIADEPQALAGYLAASRRLMPRARPRSGLLLRRPMRGFHPLRYAESNAAFDESTGEDPFAHYLRQACPAGPWLPPVLEPSDKMVAQAEALKIVVHGHFFYPELLEGLLRMLVSNAVEIDLVITTSDEGPRNLLRAVLDTYPAINARLVVVPNRGRDIAPFFSPDLFRSFLDYDLVLHIHGKRSPHVASSTGDLWRTFLWENLVGSERPMMQVIASAFAEDPKLGLVFPADPHLNDWDHNRPIANTCAERLELKSPLPNHFDFPMGTMFWARPEALKRIADARIELEEYPAEPLPIDGTLLHALERLLPFVAQEAGYHYAVTHVPGILR